MKTDANEPIGIRENEFTFTPGLTKREHIAIEMQKALIIGLFASTPRGEYHGWKPEAIANEALYHTDAIINALNDNP